MKKKLTTVAIIVVAPVMTQILPRLQQDAQDEEPQMVLHLLALRLGPSPTGQDDTRTYERLAGLC